MFRRKKKTGDFPDAASEPVDLRSDAIEPPPLPPLRRGLPGEPAKPNPTATPATPGAATIRRPGEPAVQPARRLGSFAMPTPVQRPENPESKRLTVGREISLTGEITACEVLVVEGRVEASLAGSRLIEIAPGGLFKGSAEVETAEIAGRFEGTLTVRERLFLRATGVITGTIKYGRLEVEPGGEIVGDMSVIKPVEPAVKDSAAE